MASSKLFGGLQLGDVARTVKERGAPSPFDNPGSAKPVLAAAELAIAGPTGPAVVRENILSVDPRRCRGWKFHNRKAHWFTKERCQDLITSIPKNGQKQPAVVRRVTGEEGIDYEVIYGMRRRFACEFLNTKFRVVVVDIDDTAAAVLMHIENADREDISPMERALSFQEQIDAGLFRTQDALADAIGLSKGQVAKMLRAASLLKQGTLAQLFPDVTQMPVEQSYKLATLLERPGAKEIILQAAKYLLRKESAGDAGAVLRSLMASLDRSEKLPPLEKQYNLGSTHQIKVTRNPKGKVTVAFPKGLTGLGKDEITAAFEQVLKDFGSETGSGR